MLKLLDPSQAIPDRVRSALDTMAEGLLVIDSRQNIVLANQAFSLLVQKTPAELVGQNCRAFHWANVDNSKFDHKHSPWAQALASGKAITSERIRLNLGEHLTRTFMVNCSPVLANSGKAGGVLVSFDDVTILEQKEIELMRSKEEAEIANQTKSDFLANMSHEIRTPMNAIMGFTEVLRRGYDNGQNSVKYLDTISKNSRHLLELINDILDLSKVESGQIEVEQVPCALHEIIYDVVEVLEISARNKGITLEYQPKGDLPEQVMTDPARVRQIITNLVSNAIKFTQAGSVTVTTSLIGPEADAKLELCVIDTGIGMTESQQSKIFSPFVQADTSITRRFGGTGLGLTISKKFAEALGGGIEVTSALGKGSRFTFTLACGDVSESKRLSKDQICQAKQLISQQNVIWRMPDAKVLVVDDSEENRELIKLVLTHQGLRVELASNGKQALEATQKQTFDMVLMDVQMPEMDGYTAVGIIRKTDKVLPIYALTAHAMKGIEQKCLQAGFNGYIAKPVAINLLLEAVAGCVGGEQIEVSADAVPVLKQSPTHSSIKAGESLAPVVSILQNNPKYRAIILKFVMRLEQDIAELKMKFANQQLDDARELAHKLKGSAGTVGFYPFTEPFHKMEKALREGEIEPALAQLTVVESLYARIDKTDLEADEKPPMVKQKA